MLTETKDRAKYCKREFLPRHPNAMRLTVLIRDRRTETFYSVAAGAIGGLAVNVVEC